MQSRDFVEDRNGNEVRVGDTVYYLHGSMAGDNYYETSATVTQLNARNRVVKVSSRDTLMWYEFWKERRF